MDSYDVVVVGAGINGACAASEAAARGLRVLVVDKDDAPAAEASGRAQGILRLQGRDAAEVPLAQDALRRWQGVENPDRLELRFGGNLYFCARADELSELRGLAEESARGGHAAELLSPDDVREVVPTATGPFAGAMWSASDGQCEPTLATRHFLSEATRRGAMVRLGETALNIRIADGCLSGITLSSGFVACGAVVVAAGVWTPHLLTSLGIQVPVMPVAMSEREVGPLPPLLGPAVRAAGFGGKQRPGGTIVLSGGLDAVVRHRVSLYDLRFARLWARRLLAHRRSVRLGIGVREIVRQVRSHSTCSVADLTVAPDGPASDERQLDSAVDAMARVFPAVAGAPTVRSWAGMVDMSPDGLPIVDAPLPGLAFATGLSGHGFTLGPALGSALVDLATNGRADLPVDAFALSRFDGPVPVPAKTI